ncbi:transporter substrate-binding domain-containing protein [Allopusillimonas soli]|uniref:Transporter substrate-binding domain-containing protein n=1 Tax=Allopusillimonas soli TaxID=659016 RepID=A0A853FE91_9BURK|nr:transporter substrate-binding domain-containing protein [Allopusillimonas soli]NYT38247.1 transporter substrate-binding domain-containing protein [Allopusillimonas soli]TEA72175.1 transporter substrate-binding domain-containing protein [Allopusillimonas soli]
MRISKTLSKLAFCSGVLALCATAHAEDALDRIKDAGTIRVAVAMGVPMFSYANANMQPEGSDIDTAKLLAKDLGVKLQLVEITNAARVPTIQTGKADIAVANLSITPQRQKVIDFSIPYASLQTIVAAPKDVKIKDYADLKDVTIGVTRATVNDADISKNASDANIRRFEDDATLVTAAVTGQVQAISSQWPNVAEVNKKLTDKPYETKFVQHEFMLGIALPKNNPKLQAWLNDWIKANLANGKLNGIYKKYHGSDLSGKVVKGQ